MNAFKLETTVEGASSRAAHGSPLALLREVLEKDRAAIAAMKKEAPWYVPDDEILDLHRRIESCLSANDGAVRQSPAPETP
jgi:hypothetical protein